MNHALRLFVSLTAVLAWGCETSAPSETTYRNRMNQQECSYRAPGSTYCGWQTDNGWHELCCSSDTPYCGWVPGQCSKKPTFSSDLHPLDR